MPETLRTRGTNEVLCLTIINIHVYQTESSILLRLSFITMDLMHIDFHCTHASVKNNIMIKDLENDYALFFSDLPEQAEMIIQRMRDDNLVNMQNDWKMVTLLIGGNDLCRVCDYEVV